ncbi:carbohydrate ABC transporter permease [Clostridiales bacterium FE2010]|nr:carbohydrate ABC transporter permease [Clostridiales bacterium FE2010]
MVGKEKDFDTINDGSHAIRKFNFVDVLIIVILMILCLTCILPFIHLAAKSVSSNTAVMQKSVVLWPKGLNFDAYRSIFQDGTLVHSFLYSVGVVIIFTILGMITCTCAAYPLSRRRLKGRAFFTVILMIPMYFNAGLIPTYLLYRDLKMLNTMWVLILPLIYSAYNMLIMKNYFQSSIPDSLEEAAFLDGANNFQILFQVVLPLSLPIIATLSLFYAVGRWNAYADNKYYITKEGLKMIQYKLYQLVSSATEAQTATLSEAIEVTSTPEVLQAACIMFTTLPIICIYPFLQKYFVKGVMVGAVKG